MQLVGIEVKRASDAGQLHIRARGLERHRLSDSLQLDAFLKFAIELNRAFDVGYRNFIQTPVNMHVTRDLLDLQRALFLADFDVGVDVVDRSIRMLAGNVDIAAAAADIDVPAARVDGDWRFARYGNVEIRFDRMISRTFNSGINRDKTACCRD